MSVEIEDAIGEYGPVITGVALLGAEEPAVEGATLEKALVFGGIRKGARVWSFKVGDQLPDPATLRSEFDEIRSKIADIIKGKKGAPLFRALFGNITELFERMVNGRHTADQGDANADPEQRAAKDQGNDALKNKSKEGGNLQMPEELKAIAAALGLGEEATAEDVVAAITALVEKAKAAATVPPEEMEGELAKELSKANDKIADLTKRLDGQTALSAWKEKTATFTSIPGTALEHAVKLAAIEGKAGKEAADDQFAALEAANNLAIEAGKIIGTTRTAGPTDFDNEVAKYMAAHTEATKVQAIEAVSKSHPDLYFARREDWKQ